MTANAILRDTTGWSVSAKLLNASDNLLLMINDDKRRPYDAFGDYHPSNTNQKLPIILLLYDLIDGPAYEGQPTFNFRWFFTHCYQCFVIVLLPSDQTIQRSTSPYNKLI